VDAEYRLYLILSLIAAAMSVALTIYLWRRRPAPGAAPAGWLMLTVVIWAFGYVLGLINNDLAAKAFWNNVTLVGIVFMPVIGLLFALEYTGAEEWVTRRNFLLLCIMPVITLLLIWTNDAHHWFYSEIGLDTRGAFPWFVVEHGWYFWIHTAYSYLLVSLTIVLFVRAFVYAPPQSLFRGQVAAVLLGILAAFAANFVDISELNPLRNAEVTPFAFTFITGPALAWGLSRYRLFDIAPIARGAVVDSMADGMIVLDTRNRIVDVNPALRRFIGRAASDAIGQSAEKVLAPWADLVEHYRDALEAQIEIGAWVGETRRFVELRISPLRDRRGHLIGRLVVLRDITARKRAEEELRRARDELELRVQERTAELARANEDLSSEIAERKRAEQVLAHRAGEMVALYELGLEINAQRELAVALRAIVARAAELQDARRGSLYMLRADGESLELAVSHNPFRDDVRAVLRLGEGLSGRVAQTGEPMSIADYSRWEGRAELFADGPPRRVVGVPIKVGERVIGVINVTDDTKTGEFSDDEIRLLMLFANQAAIAIENARLWDATRRRLTELEAVSRISTSLRAAQTLDELLPILVNETLAILDASAAAVWLYDPAQGELHQAVQTGFGETLETIKPGEGIAGKVFSTGQIHISRDFKTDPLTVEEARPLVSLGLSGACVPIHTAQEPIGVFFVSVRAPRALSQEQIHLLTILAEIAGNAIHRMRLHDETERRLKQMQTLHTIDVTIGSSMDLRVTLNVLLEHVASQLGVDAADVFLFNPHTHVFEYSAGRGFRSQGIEQATIRIGDSYVGRAALERRIINASLLAEAKDARLAEIFAAEGFVSHFCAPLFAKGRLKGVLDLYHRAPLAPDADWMNFLETVAGQAAIAIENGELFENLQQSNVELALAYDTTLEGWARALDLRDQEPEGHTQRVTDLTVRLARALGMNDADIVHLRRGALLHDIGKMGVSDSILLKPGALDEEEWKIVRMHPTYARGLLSPIPFLRPAIDVPYCHHEKWDGTGYPRGLKGEEIPLAARVFAVVDVWDALRSDRPYRHRWSEEETLQYIRAQSGKHFDPTVVREFLGMMRER
jgi:PAS domain S-box-containing protein